MLLDSKADPYREVRRKPALECVQIDGKPYVDPHTEVGDYVLERTLTKWPEWMTGMRVVLEEFE